MLSLIHICRILECRFEGIATIIGLVVLQRINLVILKDFLMFRTGRAENFQVRLLARIRRLWNTTAIPVSYTHLDVYKRQVFAP